MENSFGINIMPANEEERLAKLYSYKILKPYSREGAFKHIAGMAAHIFNVPIAIVSFVDKDLVHFIGNIGMEGVDEVSRGNSLCSLAILKDEVTVFEDTWQETCLLGNPMVSGEFGLKFYAGAPLKTPEGLNIGTVCIIDKKAGRFSKADQHLLEGLAAAVMDELEERRTFMKPGISWARPA